MRLTEFLSESTIKVPLEGTTKEEVLAELTELLCRGRDESESEAVLQSVMERERLMSSGVGHGIALPHGFWHADGSTSLAAALGIAFQPVDFDAIDGVPVTLVFLLVSDEARIDTKLRALARISRLLHREEFRRQLAESTTAADAMRVIVGEESRHKI
jgi:mannitol/fructose-specific phosphotransferase system IIA component (Ntr-type)